MSCPEPLNQPLEFDQPVISLDAFSEDSMQILSYFGLDAPHLLNEYSCALEDSLITFVARSKFVQKAYGESQAALSESIDHAQALEKQVAEITAQLKACQSKTTEQEDD